jgi:predicted peptidase
MYIAIPMIHFPHRLPFWIKKLAALLHMNFFLRKSLLGVALITILSNTIPTFAQSNGTKVLHQTVDSACTNELTRLPGRSSFIKSIDSTDSTTREYVYIAPENEEQNKRYPLILVLHHGGVRGRFQYLFNPGPPGRPYGIGYFLTKERRKEFPTHIFIPSTEGEVWDEKTINAAITLTKKFFLDRSVDWRRVYVIGQSMGADGVLIALHKYSNLFAAGLAVGAGGIDEKFGTSKEPPLLIVSTTDEKHSGLKERQEVAIARGNGAEIAHWEVQNADHEQMSQITFCEEELGRWLFSHTRPQVSERKTKRTSLLP